jgi:hypothetical protein
MTRAAWVLTIWVALGSLACAEEQPNDDLFGGGAPAGSGGSAAGSAGSGGMTVASGGTGVGLKDAGPAGTGGMPGTGGTPGSGGASGSGFGGSGGALPSAGSCTGACGGPAPDESCFCDVACSTYGDCCADFTLACPAEASTPATGCTPASCNSDQPVADENGTCYCDAACAEYGDCCSNKIQICG